MKKYLFGLLIAILSNMIISSNARPCSIATQGVAWPHNNQTDIPTNAIVVIFCATECDDITVSLINSGTNTKIPLTRTGNTTKLSFYDYIEFAPANGLDKLSEYTIKMGYKTIKFTTGESADSASPILNKDKVTLEIDWLADKKTALYGLWCVAEEFTVDEIAEMGIADKLTEKSYLPEHYNIKFTFAEASDQTDMIIYDIYEVDSDGTETIIDTKNSNEIWLPRMTGIENNSQKTYRFKFKDILGNAIEEPIDIVVNFKETDSEYSINGGGFIGGGGGGGGGGGDSPEASGGCSMSHSGGTSSLAALLMFVLCNLALITARRWTGNKD